MTIPGLEAVWIETKIDQNVLLVGSLYRPPSSPVSYWKLIEDSIKKAVNSPHRFIVLGDFNDDPWNNPSPHLLKIIEENNLFQLIDEPTRITSTTSRCIDLIFTNNRDLVDSVSVRPPIGSDHCITGVKLKSRTMTNRYINKKSHEFFEVRCQQISTGAW